MNATADTSVYIGLTLVVFGFAAVMTGAALASNWRPWLQLLVYTLLLGAADRFLVYALFGGDLLSLSGYLRDTASLLLIGAVSYRITQVKKMVTQYPWQYQRQNWFFYRSVDR